MIIFLLLAVAAAVVKLDFTAYEQLGDGLPRIRDLLRRDTGPMELKNQKSWYSTELEFGSEKQKITVQVDTGSCELWVFHKGALCLARSRDLPQEMELKLGQNACQVFGEYDSSNLKAFENLTEPYKVLYADNTGAYGTYVKDDITFGEVTLEGLQFAAVDRGSLAWGVLGIGTISGEYTDKPYPNFPALLKEQGHISKNLYSVYLDNMSAKLGSIIFGGVDTAKIESDLVTLPIVNSYASYVELAPDILIRIDQLKFQDEQINSHEYHALLDTGTTRTYLPRGLYYSLLTTLGAKNFQGDPAVPCPASEDVKLTFNFGGAEIDVPLAQLVSEYRDGWCWLLGLALQPEDYLIIGDSVLRHAYTVFDLDSMKVSIGKVKFTLDLNVEEVSDLVPKAKDASSMGATTVLMTYQLEPSRSKVDYTTGTGLVTDHYDVMYGFTTQRTRTARASDVSVDEDLGPSANIPVSRSASLELWLSAHSESTASYWSAYSASRASYWSAYSESTASRASALKASLTTGARATGTPLPPAGDSGGSSGSSGSGGTGSGAVPLIVSWLAVGAACLCILL